MKDLKIYFRTVTTRNPDRSRKEETHVAFKFDTKAEAENFKEQVKECYYGKTVKETPPTGAPEKKPAKGRPAKKNI